MDEFITDYAQFSDCEEYRYIKEKGWFIPYPYKWSEEYKPSNIQMVSEGESLAYVELDGKKLYMPKSKSIGWRGKELINSLLIEQDYRSPHRYFVDSFAMDEETVFLDIGAAEGLITLTNIDKIKEAYLFECQKEWIEALEKTFCNEKQKIHIVNKFVDVYDDETHVTLAGVLKKHIGNPIMIKMDIEGMEVKVVKNVLETCKDIPNVKFVCCTYHNSDDSQVLKELFEENSFHTEFSEGYMCFGYPKELRKGVIRAWIS